MLLLLMALMPMAASADEGHGGMGHSTEQSAPSIAIADCVHLEHTDCQTIQAEENNHDDCCKKSHCESSSGAQICTAPSLAADIPSANAYATEGPIWVPTQDPSRLLRPPLSLS